MDYLAADGERGIGVRYRRGSLRDGYHDYGQQQARKLPNARSARQRRDIGIVGSMIYTVRRSNGLYLVDPAEERLEGKSGASSRGNSSSKSV